MDFKTKTAPDSSGQVRRILMTADSLGGVWTYAIELSRALADHNIEVALATMGPPLTRSQHEEAQALPNLNLFKSNFKLEWMQDCWRDVRQAGEWLLHLEKRLRPDVVHLNGYVHASLPWTTAKVVVGHSCVYSWWQAVMGKDPTELQKYKHEVTRGIRAADMVVAPTTVMLSTLAQHYGPLPSARSIPNGCNPKFFKDGKKSKLVFAAGRLWDEAKNVKMLADVAVDLPWSVCIAGDTVNPETTSPAEVNRQNCYVLGALPQSLVREWYARASIYALPAKYEPFGYTALEAALSGCALVLGDIPSLREVWSDAAVFVAPSDKTALRIALLRMINDERYRKQMAQRARERGYKYTHSRMANEYLSVYFEARRGFAKKAATQELMACA